MKNTLIAFFAAATMALGTAWAAPTAQLRGGDTTVELSPDFVNALVGLGVEPGRIKPGSLKLNKGTVSFPIPGGAIDAESLAGDIFHTGGLTLAVPGTTVSLLNFIISTTGEPILTGIAAVNGDVVDRIPLFDLDLSAAIVEVGNKNQLRVGPVGVTLTDVAADTLNSVFGVDAFTEGFPIGTAYVKAKIRGTQEGTD
jgi:hypothetical protein